MFGIQYFKADASTYVIKTAGGKIRKKGKGLSFFYSAAVTSIATIPVSTQEAPFIFKLQTDDFQEVAVQGQVTYRIADPEKAANMLNFGLQKDGSRASEDPLKLSDRVVRTVQTIVQNEVQAATLRDSLTLSKALVSVIKAKLGQQSSLESLGIHIIDASIAAISPPPDTARALEAGAREAILKEADDAIYARRKSAVEQELTIKQAELQTELSVQQKEQEIEESRIANEREILRGTVETERERLEAEIHAENQRKELVLLNVENARQESDSEAYAISARMNAFKELPVENLKAMALANMQADQLMALAFESMAQNADKIGELNIGPEVFTRMMKKAVHS
jgi:regulator of protease activity HflC (stomatin/prohibitin superfamily)